MESLAKVRRSPARVLGPIDAMCIVIGAIIGVGIFFNPSAVAGLVKSETLVLLAWGIGGAIALCGALTFAELGGMFTGSGAQYDVLRSAYGPFPAFVYVFCIITIIEPGSIAVMGLICAQNLMVASGVPSDSAALQGDFMLGLAIALIAALTVANIFGARWGARIQNLTVYAKLAALLAIAVIAMAFASSGKELGAVVAGADAAGDGSAPNYIVQAMLSALVPVLFAYGGWQQLMWVAGEVRDPRRNVPRAVIGGVMVVVAVYLIVNWAYLALLGAENVAKSDALAADAVGAAFPGWGSRLVAGAVAISAFGVLNTQLLTAPRLIFGMAHDGRFFPIFASLHRRWGTPVPAIALLTIFSIATLFVAGSLEKLVTGVVVVDALFFALTGMAVIILRYTLAGADRPMRVPGYPIVPLLFVLGELGAIAGSLLDASVREIVLLPAALIAIAALMYAIWFRRASR